MPPYPKLSHLTNANTLAEVQRFRVRNESSTKTDLGAQVTQIASIIWVVAGGAGEGGHLRFAPPVHIGRA
jgi:hypothetical protein